MLFSSLYWKPLDCFSIGHCSCSASSTFTSVNVLLNAVTLQRGTRCKALCLHQTLHFTLKRISMYIFHIDHSPILGMKSLNSLCVCHTVAVSLPSLVEKDIIPPTHFGLKQSQLLLLFTENKTCIHSSSQHFCGTI